MKNNILSFEMLNVFGYSIILYIILLGWNVKYQVALSLYGNKQ